MDADDDDLSPSERRQQREQDREERRKRKAERDEKKVSRLVSKYSSENPRKVGVVDVELISSSNGNVQFPFSRSRSESLESASDPPTRLERYFGETAGADDSRRISWSFVLLMFSVAFWNGVLDLAMLSLQRILFNVSYEVYFFIIIVLTRILFGLVSDSCPRQRRKPYLLVASFCGFVVLVVAALVPLETSLAVLAIFFSLWLLAALADVVTDGLIVERSIGKELVVLWRLQAKSWLFRSLGGVFVFFAGDWLLDNTSPQLVFGFLSLCPGLVGLCAFFLTDTPITVVHCAGMRGFCRECAGVGRVMLKKSPFFSFCLLLVVCLMPQSSFIMEMYLERQVKFSVFAATTFSSSSFVLSSHYLKGATWLVSSLVCVFYPISLQKKSPRSTFFFTSLINVFVGLLPLLLITNTSAQFDVPDAVVVFVSAILLRIFSSIQFLALRVMCVQFVPNGIEASFFAILTAVFSLSTLGGQAFGTAIAEAWGVGCFPQCDFSSLLPFFLLCQLIPLFPLAICGFVSLHIRGKDEYVCACLPWARSGSAPVSPRSGEKKVYLLSSTSSRVPSPTHTHGFTSLSDLSVEVR